METIVESHCLIVSRYVLTTLVEVDVTIPQVSSQVVGIVTKNCLCCFCRERVLTLCVCTEYSLTVLIDVVGVVIPSELHSKCALFEESCLAVYLCVNVLTTGCATLAEKDVEGTLVLNTRYDVNAKAVHLFCISITRTHKDFLSHLLGYVLKRVLADKIFGSCCHNCVLCCC